MGTLTNAETINANAVMSISSTESTNTLTWTLPENYADIASITPSTTIVHVSPTEWTGADGTKYKLSY